MYPTFVRMNGGVAGADSSSPIFTCNDMLIIYLLFTPCQPSVSYLSYGTFICAITKTETGTGRIDRKGIFVIREDVLLHMPCIY